MTKITERINLKAAVAGAAVLTAFSYLAPPSAHTLVLRWGGQPDLFEYDFTVDTEEPNTSAVQTLTITEGNSSSNSATNIDPLGIQVSPFSGNRTVLDDIFDQINFAGNVPINNNDIFEYSIDLSTDGNLSNFVTDDDGNLVSSIGFVVPTNFTVDGNPITFNPSDFNDPLNGLEEIAGVLGNSGGNVEFPIVTDGSPAFLTN